MFHTSALCAAASVAAHGANWAAATVLHSSTAQLEAWCSGCLGGFAMLTQQGSVQSLFPSRFAGAGS